MLASDGFDNGTFWQLFMAIAGPRGAQRQDSGLIGRHFSSTVRLWCNIDTPDYIPNNNPSLDYQAANQIIPK